MKEKILEVLNDYELWLKDKERFDYVAGLIEHRVMEGKADKTSGEKRYFDVKYASKRKNHKPTHNPNINRCLSKAQQELPLLVEILYVDDNGQITIQRASGNVA